MNYAPFSSFNKVNHLPLIAHIGSFQIKKCNSIQKTSMNFVFTFWFLDESSESERLLKVTSICDALFFGTSMNCHFHYHILFITSTFVIAYSFRHIDWLLDGRISIRMCDFTENVEIATKLIEVEHKIENNNKNECVPLISAAEKGDFLNIFKIVCRIANLTQKNGLEVKTWSIFWKNFFLLSMRTNLSA